jgi:hypothetical protein
MGWILIALAMAVAACSSSGGGGGGGADSGTDGDTDTDADTDTDTDTDLAPSLLTAVWANDGADKIVQDDLRASGGADVTSSIWDGERISLFAARNEVVSFALVLEAAEVAAPGVSVAFTALETAGDAQIVSEPATGDGLWTWVDRNIELFYVRYLQIKGLSTLSYDHYDERHIPERLRRPWTGDGYGEGSWEDRPDHDRYYPEIAVPLELAPEFEVAAGASQTIWVDVYVPDDAPPGQYEGTVGISEGGEPTWAIPVRLEVLDFALPDVPSAPTMLVLGDADVNLRYLGEEYPNPGTEKDTLSRQIRDRHFQLAHRHKISLIGDTVDPAGNAPHDDWLARLDGSLFTAANGYDGPGVGVGNGVYSIATYGSWGWDGEGASGMQDHADAWVSWFDANAPDAEYFLYLIDESDDYAQIETWAQWIEGGPAPGNALMSMATIGLPEAAANTPSLDVVASTLTVGITDEWQTAADAWLADPAKRFYMYNGSRPASGSFCTEDDGVALRELAWGQFKKGIQRWFYWESTYYNDFQGGRGQQNVFANAQTFGGEPAFDAELGETSWNHTNGDGVLFYPGTDTVFPEVSYDAPGPFASLRLKHWRRGIQDVDYLALAAAVDAAATAEIVAQMVPEVLWEYGVEDLGDPTWVRTDISWSIDPDDWEAARRALAEIILGGA